RHLLAPPTKTLHHGLVGDAQQNGLAGCLVTVRTPCRHRDDVAAPPLEPLAVNEGNALALHHGIDIVCRGAIERSADVWIKPHHVKRRGGERGIPELDVGTERPARLGFCSIQPEQRLLEGEYEG